MAWSALLLSENAGVLSPLQAALQEMQVAPALATTVAAAREKLELGRYDAIVCDCEITADPDLLRSLRQASVNPKLVLIALVPTPGAMQTAFNQGANFVVCKPLNDEVVHRTLRAALCVLHRLSRRYPRRAVHTLAMVTIDGASDKAILMQLGEGGMGIQALEPLEVSRAIRLQFELPGTLFTIDTLGEIAWADPSGRIGIRFPALPDSARDRIREWVFSDALEAAPAAEDDVPVPTGKLRLVPAPQRLCAILIDGLIAVAASALFELVVLTMVSDWPHRMMAQATALAVPALFWSVYQFLFLHAHTPGAHLARRLASRFAAPAKRPWTSTVLGPARSAWRIVTRIGARLEMETEQLAVRTESSITIQPPARS